MSMKALYNNKVYFGEPLTYIAGSQDSRMNKSRRTGKALAELVIGIIFLQRRQLAHLQLWGEIDVLEDFKHVCLNFEANRDYQEDQKRIKTEAYEANEQVHAEFSGHQYRIQQAGENNVQVNSEYSGDDYIKTEFSDEGGSRASFGTRTSISPAVSHAYTASWARLDAAPFSVASTHKYLTTLVITHPLTIDSQAIPSRHL
jgi:hypothetical protein